MAGRRMAWLDPWSWRSTWLSLALLLVACAGVLGIEDRKLDSSDSYPADGYEGCRPGAGCDGCLDVHKDECQVRSACADAATTHDCAGCVCENCLDPVVDCQLDAGCAAIWQCLRETRCDLSEHASNSCLDDCAGVIQNHGGVNGEAFRAAAGIRTCAVTSSCLSCLAPQPEPSPSCNQANGCQDCGACLQQCICSGDGFLDCKVSCGEEAPPESCTPAASCVGCTNCFETCACGGGTFDECTVACQADPLPPLPTCSTETGCSDCADCVTTCVCTGSDQALCESECAPPAPDDVCSEDSQAGGAHCDGCSTCLADCTCRGSALVDCMNDCSLDACNSGANCSGVSCDVNDVGSCNTCVCQNCSGTYALCQYARGCTAIFECMRSTNCHGSQCRERCTDVNLGSEVPEAFDVAESLWACHQGNQCGCTEPPPAPVTCIGGNGAVECSSYVGNDITLAACCPAPILTTKAGGSIGPTGDASCGLAIRSYFPNALECEPLDQQRPPAFLLGACSGARIVAPPYNGAALDGCCRADDSCGFYDNVTGLGCLSASVFGISTAESCGGLL